MTTFEEHLSCKYYNACLTCGCCNCQEIRIKAINEYKHKVKEALNIIPPGYAKRIEKELGL